MTILLRKLLSWGLGQDIHWEYSCCQRAGAGRKGLSIAQGPSVWNTLPATLVSLQGSFLHTLQIYVKTLFASKRSCLIMSTRKILHNSTVHTDLSPPWYLVSSMRAHQGKTNLWSRQAAGLRKPGHRLTVSLLANIFPTSDFSLARG